MRRPRPGAHQYAVSNSRFWNRAAVAVPAFSHITRPKAAVPVIADSNGRFTRMLIDWTASEAV